MTTKLKNKFFANSYWDLVIISVFILAVLGILSFVSKANPLMIDNDSWQYLSIAQRIYDKSSLHSISGAILDLAFDQIAQANYDLNKIKPYHFPIYSIFLSGFFYIYNNQFFVALISQFLLCVVFLYSSHLILQNYVTRKKSLAICLSAFFFSPLFIYALDTGKEIFCPALATLCFYLGLYSKRRDSFLLILCYFLAITVLILARNFYILIPVFCLLYRLLPERFREEEEDKKEGKWQLLIFLIACILLPYAVYQYCYQNLDLFYFQRDRMEPCYLDLKIDYQLLLSKVANNLTRVAYSFTDPFLMPQFYLFLISLIAFFFYFLRLKIWLILSPQSWKLSKSFCIFFFYAILLIAITVLYEIGGYRMLEGFMPFAFYIIFKNTSSLISFSVGRLKTLIVALALILCDRNFETVNHYNLYQKNIGNNTADILDLMQKYDTKIFAMTTNYQPESPMLLVNKMPSDSFYVGFFYPKYFCQELTDYSNHGIYLKIIGVSASEKYNSCQFLNQNYNLIKQDDKKSLYVLKKLELTKMLTKKTIFL